MPDKCQICGYGFDKTITKQEMFGKGSFNTDKYDKYIGCDTVYFHRE